MAREAGQQDQRARSPASLGGGRKRRLKGGLGEVGGAGARGFLAPTGSASSTGWVGLQIRQVACERRRRLGRRGKGMKESKEEGDAASEGGSCALLPVSTTTSTPSTFTLTLGMQVPAQPGRARP